MVDKIAEVRKGQKMKTQSVEGNVGFKSAHMFWYHFFVNGEFHLPESISIREGIAWSHVGIKDFILLSDPEIRSDSWNNAVHFCSPVLNAEDLTMDHAIIGSLQG